MLTRQRLYSCLLLFLLALFGNRAHAEQTPPSLPACQPFASRLYPSPTVVQDHIVFASNEWSPTDIYVRYLRKSTDRGLTWHRLTGLPQTERWRAQVNFSTNYAADQTLTVAFRSLTNISSDGGVSWRVIIFPRTTATAFALGDAQHLFLGYGQEIGLPQPMELLASDDGGQTWQVRYQGLEVRDVQVSPAFTHDHTLLVTLGLYHYNGGILKSTDAGRTWQRADAGIHFPGGDSIESLRFSPTFATDRTLFCVDDASAMGSTTYKSTDAGASWRPMADPSPPPYPGPELLISPRYQQDQTLWAVWGYQPSRVSHDGGQTWLTLPYLITPVAAAEYCRPTGVCGIELFGRTLHKGASIEEDTYYMYRSYDYGETWQCLEDPTLPQEPTPTPPPPVEIPEPATGLLLAAGSAALAALVGGARQRRIRPGRNRDIA